MSSLHIKKQAVRALPKVFNIEHPLKAAPLGFAWCMRRWLLLSALAYPAYLLFMGPFYALDAHGRFDFAPQSVRTVFYLPAAPLYLTMGPNNPYDDYLRWWHDDPNAAETTW